MKIVISGASGLVGSALVPVLRERGDTVLRLVRSERELNSGTILWHPTDGSTDIEPLEGIDAVVHLAGENLAGGRWTEQKKARIRDSRVDGTRTLCRALANLRRKPAVFVSASAVGYYGNRGAEMLTEESARGKGFLAEVTQMWESAASPARESSIRVVHLRFGMILSPSGGALAKMLPVFRFGMGGVIGSGRQYWSWVAIDDVVGAIQLALDDTRLAGPVNVVAPQAVTNREFTKTLGRVLSRPTFFWVPAAAARLAFGEMADETLLASTRVEPARLIALGYPFRHRELEPALRTILGKV